MFRPGDVAGQWRSVDLDWQSRAHFLGIAAKQMRQVLIDHGRAKSAGKRAGLKVALDDAGDMAATPPADFERLDQMLTLLEANDAEAARVVELKFFGGLTDREAAEVMGISVARLRRSWEFARSWLRHRVAREDS
jgi:RNA polymerase sigma factor (TIGR02999 family)